MFKTLILTSPLQQFSNYFFKNTCIFLNNQILQLYLIVFIFIITFLSININKVSNIKIKLTKNLNLLTLLINIIKNEMKKNIKKNILLIFLVTIGIFIWIANFTALIPFTNSLTGTTYLPLFISLTAFIALNIFLITIFKQNIISFFIPSSAPIALKPFLGIIEFISHNVKSLSLSIRLFANMFAGHVLGAILGGGVFNGFKSLLFTIIPVIGFIFIILIQALEGLVCFLQGYVFIVLLGIYFRDVFSMHTH
jgi:ATP synthase subunit 6